MKQKFADREDLLDSDPKSLDEDHTEKVDDELDER